VSDIASLFTWRRHGVLVAAITGEIDISNARSLESTIVDVLGSDSAGLVVDLAGLSFLDGSGAHLLYALSDRLRGRGLGFAIVLPEATSPPRRVLDLSGPRPAHWIHPTEDDAITAVLRAR
jgi:anti-sigma B factor antagonist